MAMTDIVITTILPFIIITKINILIAYKLKNKPCLEKKNCRKKKRKTLNYLTSFSSHKKNTVKTVTFAETTQPLRTKKSVKFNEESMAVTYQRESNVSFLIRKSTQIKRTKVYSEATKTLFIISFVFLLLHCPLAMNKTLYFLNENLSIKTAAVIEDISYDMDLNSTNSTHSYGGYANLETSEYEEIFERITCYVFYLSFSLNFFLYNSKAKFRNIILKHFRSTYKNWL